MTDIPISYRLTEFTGQQHRNLQTDEDVRNLTYTPPSQGDAGEWEYSFTR